MQVNMLKTKDGKILQTVSEAADHFRVSCKTVNDWIKKEIIPVPPQETYGLRSISTFPTDYIDEATRALREYREQRKHRSVRDQLGKEHDILSRDIAIKAKAITDELIRYLTHHPEYLDKLHPRQFEELIAEIVVDMGYSVELTPASRDGGRDVLAHMSTPLGGELTIIECKRFNHTRTVGIELVRQFLWVLEEEDRANRGIIATTSYFTSDAYILQNEHKWRLGLRDFNHLTEWLAQYGSWKNKRESGLWVPRK